MTGSRKVLVAVAMILVVAGLGLFASRAYFLRKIGGTWTPLDLSAVEARAVERLGADLSRLGTPNAAVFVGAAELSARLERILERVGGLSEPRVDLRDYAITVRSKFTVDKSLGDWLPFGKLQDLRVSGSVQAAVLPEVDAATGAIAFPIRFEDVQVTEVRLGNLMIGENTANAISAVVFAFLDHLNGALDRACRKPEAAALPDLPTCVAAFPTSYAATLDASQAGTDIRVDAQPVAFNLAVRAAVVLVDPQGVHALARLEPSFMAPMAAPAGEVRSQNPEALRTQVRDLARGLLHADPRPNAIMAGLDGALTAAFIEYAAGRSSLTMQGRIVVPPQNFDTEIRLAQEPRFSCSQNMGCTRDECRKVNCSTSREERCVGIGGDVGRFLSRQARTVCNIVEKVTCEGGKAVGTVLCEAKEVLDKGSCEMAKTLRKGGCELNKGFVQTVLGKIGGVSGDYRVEGSYLAVLAGVSVESDLSSIEVRLRGFASARARGNLRFVPANHGHMLLCISKWKEDFDVTVVVPDVPRSARARITAVGREVGQPTRLRFAIEPVEFVGRVSPTPFDAVFSQHPHLRLACSIPAALGELARFISLVDGDSSLLPDDLDRVVSGDVRYKLENASFTVDLPPLEVKLGDDAFRLSALIEGGDLVFRQ